MSINLLILCLLLSGSTGIAIGGTIASLFGWLLLAILLVLVWEYKVYIFLIIFILAVTLLIVLKIRENQKKRIEAQKYKDETPEEREERLKTEKMIEEWRRKNYF